MSTYELPNNPYVGQIFYNPDSEKTYEFSENSTVNDQENQLDETIYENIKINKNKNQFSITDQMVSLLGTSLLQLKNMLLGLGYIIKKDDSDCKKIIWLANIKKTRRLYKKDKSKNVKSINNFFNDTDLKKIRQKFSSK